MSPPAARADLGRCSLGVGDRFGHQAEAQLRAFELAEADGVVITPVWNKSYREHQMLRTRPEDVRVAAEAAIRRRRWRHGYFVDADHITLDTVDEFVDSCDFFTIDVTGSLGLPPDPRTATRFLRRAEAYLGPLPLANSVSRAEITRADLDGAASHYLCAADQAAAVVEHLHARLDRPFVVEVSMDESETPQSAVELFLILVMLADRQIPLQTIAPKFCGRFNKGVDFVGDVASFERQFAEHLAVVRLATSELPVPGTLKLSIHSGSDKFSLYPVIRRLTLEAGAGLHLKTAGTTWLEELVGLAESDGEGLDLVKRIYREAMADLERLCQPYQAVLDIDPGKLPSVAIVDRWRSDEYAAALRHRPGCPEFNPHFRQLLHVAFRVAGEMGEPYLGAVRKNETTIARNVTENLYERHIRPLFCSKSRGGHDACP